MKRSVLSLAMLTALLALGCPSGLYGQRPVVEFRSPETTGNDGPITVHFTISDDDYSVSSVIFEYSADSGPWTIMALISASSGTVSGPSVQGLTATPTGVDVDAVWDSWADDVGKAGNASVLIRLTPVDTDGRGESVVLPAAVTINNNFPELLASHASIDFGTRLARVAETPAQDIDLVITNGTGDVGTVLYWEVVSDQAWLVVGAASGTAPAVAPYESSVALTADVDGAGLTANAAAYEATLTITGYDTNVAGAAAVGSPISIPVTVTVRDPEAEVFLHNGDGSTEVTALPQFSMLEGEANPASQSFWIKNAGEVESILVWAATDNLTTTDWLVDFETTPTGELNAGDSVEVTVAVDGSGLTGGIYNAAITVAGTEKTSGDTAVGSPKTVAVSLSVTSLTIPEIGLSPTTLTFNADPAFGDPASQTIDITNTGGGTLSWSASSDQLWLAISPVLGTTTTETDTLTVSPIVTRDDEWLTAISTTNAPSARRGHSAVWTGTEMIIWGGYNGGSYWPSQASDCLVEGYRYDPATNSWSTISAVGAPSGRVEHSAVWTGSKMIVFGGTPNGSSTYSDGGAYDPATNTWSPIASASTGRSRHTAVWTGTQMIVWGGLTGGSTHTNTGDKYDPGTNTWVGSTAVDGNTPSARKGAVAVWTGTEMVVFGGAYNSTVYADTAKYSPTLDSWTTAADAPMTMLEASAVWTGSQMIVWGGSPAAAALTNQGYCYDPTADSWVHATTTVGALSEREWHSAVWTGSQMIVWGGRNGVYHGDGKPYVPPISLSYGTYTGTITISDPAATNDPQTVSVTLNVAMDGSLEAWWELDESAGTTASDSSGNGTDGTLHSGPVWQPSSGVIGGALSFDGADDYVEFPSSDQQVLTIAAWVNTSASGTSQNPRIIETSAFRLHLPTSLLAPFSGSGIEFDVERQTATGAWQGLAPIYGTGWRHVAVTYDGSSTANDPVIYVDGVAQQISEALAPAGAIVSNVGVGNIGNRPSGHDRPFDGLIDDVRIYSRVLSAAEIDALADDISTGLVAHWEFEEGSGQDVADSTGNGNDGLLGDTSSVEANDPQWTTGKVGTGALSFDGDNDRVTIGTAPLAPPWTAAMWVKRQDSSSGAAKLLAVQSTNHTLRLEQWDGTNKVGFSGATGSDYVFNYEAPIDVWAHLTFVCTGTETRLYADGTLVDTNANCIDLPMWFIGTQSTDMTMKGVLDDVRLYSRVLSGSEIQTLSQMGQ